MFNKIILCILAICCCTTNAFAVEAKEIDKILLTPPVTKTERLSQHLNIMNHDVELIILPEKKIMGWQQDRWTSDAGYGPSKYKQLNHYPDHNKPESELLHLRW